MFYKTLREMLKDESGATAIEYGLIAGLVSVAAILALTDMGDALKSMFEYVKTSLEGAIPQEAAS